MTDFTLIDGGKKDAADEEHFEPSTYTIKSCHNGEYTEKEVTGFLIHFGEYLGISDDPQPRLFAPIYMVPGSDIVSVVMKSDDAS